MGILHASTFLPVNLAKPRRTNERAFLAQVYLALPSMVVEVLHYHLARSHSVWTTERHAGYMPSSIQ